MDNTDKLSLCELDRERNASDIGEDEEDDFEPEWNGDEELEDEI
jgi:hypothetical protein